MHLFNENINDFTVFVAPKAQLIITPCPQRDSFRPSSRPTDRPCHFVTLTQMDHVVPLPGVGTIEIELGVSRNGYSPRFSPHTPVYAVHPGSRDEKKARQAPRRGIRSPSPVTHMSPRPNPKLSKIRQKLKISTFPNSLPNATKCYETP